MKRKHSLKIIALLLIMIMAVSIPANLVFANMQNDSDALLAKQPSVNASDAQDAPVTDGQGNGVKMPPETEGQEDEIQQSYTVVFTYHEGFKEVTVKEGESATPPTNQEIGVPDGKKFVKWDSDAYQNVTQNLTIEAVYENIRTLRGYPNTVEAFKISYLSYPEEAAIDVSNWNYLDNASLYVNIAITPPQKTNEEDVFTLTVDAPNQMAFIVPTTASYPYGVDRITANKNRQQIVIRLKADFTVGESTTLRIPIEPAERSNDSLVGNEIARSKGTTTFETHGVFREITNDQVLQQHSKELVPIKFNSENIFAGFYPSDASSINRIQYPNVYIGWDGTMEYGPSYSRKYATCYDLVKVYDTQTRTAPRHEPVWGVTLKVYIPEGITTTTHEIHQDEKGKYVIISDDNNDWESLYVASSYYLPVKRIDMKLEVGDLDSLQPLQKFTYATQNVEYELSYTTREGTYQQSFQPVQFSAYNFKNEDDMVIRAAGSSDGSKDVSLPLDFEKGKVSEINGEYAFTFGTYVYKNSLVKHYSHKGATITITPKDDEVFNMYGLELMRFTDIDMVYYLQGDNTPHIVTPDENNNYMFDQSSLQHRVSKVVLTLNEGFPEEGIFSNYNNLSYVWWINPYIEINREVEEHQQKDIYLQTSRSP